MNVLLITSIVVLELILVIVYYFSRKKVLWKVLSLSDALNLLIIPLTGAVITIIISDKQIESANDIANNQQKLAAIQAFNERLTGDRISREISLKCLKILSYPDLSNSDLYDSLIRISDLATIEKLQDSIWDENKNVRVNAIIEYAKLYNKYSREVIAALLPRFESHLENWAPMISISQFFDYLSRYSTDGIWEGTIEDYNCFARMKTSKYYIDSANVKKYLDYGLKNFRERKEE